MHRHELAVLSALKKSKRLSMSALLAESGLGRDAAEWAVSNLSAGGLVRAESEKGEGVALTQEGRRYAESELPEQSLVKRLAHGAIKLSELMGIESQIALIWAKRRGLADISNGALAITQEGRKAARDGLEEDRVLKELAKGGADAYAKYKRGEAFKELLQRKLVEARGSVKVTGEVEITQRGILALARELQSAGEEIEELDRSAIASRAWAGKKFREYNVGAPVEPAEAATRHPLRLTIDQIRDAYVSLGFREVSGPTIEPAFRVFDYLFVPQDHPARDVQDTFFMGRPSELRTDDRELVGRIRKEHEKAWWGEWSEKTASRAVARTHTTSVTGRYIDETVKRMNAGEELELPIKLFTVGRNFRNETPDPKHSPDFYQHDGIIIGRNLTLANLFDTLIRLYDAIGISGLKFKPYYYPFVEPGVLMLGRVGNELMELGGAGVIRREITGMARSKMNVLAWGPGVERILLMKRQARSITDLYGSSIGWLRGRSIV